MFEPGVNQSGPSGPVFETGMAMSKQNQPTKESVRKWLHAQIEQRRPPPDPEQIRRELGWGLVKVTPSQKR